MSCARNKDADQVDTSESIKEDAGEAKPSQAV